MSLKSDGSGRLLPDPLPERRAMTEALRALGLPRRPPLEADAPPPSTFPRTRAAREALRMDREDRRKR